MMKKQKYNNPTLKNDEQFHYIKNKKHNTFFYY